jgi:adenosylcobinamide-GDP ribazoletransferase
MLAAIAGALMFYTVVPIPNRWGVEFRAIARWGPVVGLLIGALLALLDGALGAIAVPPLSRAVVIVLAWVAVTGGLHLDGVMDTADGLAVVDPQRRLAVMADSRTGAFGAIAGMAVLLIKVAALADLADLTGVGPGRSLVLLLVPLVGRWGQVVAIARYPYLRSQGKGALHKRDSGGLWDLRLGTGVAIAIAAAYAGMVPGGWPLAVALVVGGGAIAIAVAAWLNRRFGGHTGDTYGATVEWTEALLLLAMVPLVAAATP